MSLPRFSTGRPVLTTMVTLIVVTLGLVSLQRLQIDLLPTKRAYASRAASSTP